MKYEDYTDQQIRQYAKTVPIKDWRKQLKNGKSNQLLLDMVPESSEEECELAYDLGCGEGYHTEDLRNKGYLAYGIELSPKRVKDGRAMGREYIREGDIHKLPWAQNTAKIVFMHEVLEHSLYPDKVLKEVHRVLEPYGIFYASLPLEGHWRKPQEPLQHDFSIKDMHPWKPTADRLWKALEKAEFSMFKIMLYTLDSIKFRQEHKLNKSVQGFRPHAFVEAFK